jgi:hypothetical protein
MFGEHLREYGLGALTALLATLPGCLSVQHWALGDGDC